MSNYYQTLGVDAGATQDEIKAAYRKLAMKHHPDRMGGDDTKFKEIQNAYATIGDQQKRAEYDQQQRGGQQFRYTTESGFRDFSDLFGGAFDPFGHQSNPFFGRGRKNKDLNIQCQISFIDSFHGKQLEASYKMPSGKHQTVVINVPAGIRHGETIRYQGLGDDTFPHLPRGDLNVTIIVYNDDRYERRGNDIYTYLEISPIEAMIGCSKTIETISGSRMPVQIRPGVETGVEYASNGHGFPIINTDSRGKFVAVVKIKSMAVTDPAIIQKLKQIDDEISRKKS